MPPSAVRIIRQAENGIAVPDAKSSSARFLLGKWWIVIAAALAIVTLATLRYSPSPEERAFKKFWSPVLENSNTVLIGLRNNLCFMSFLMRVRMSITGTIPRHSYLRRDGTLPFITALGTPIDSKY